MRFEIGRVPTGDLMAAPPAVTSGVEGLTDAGGAGRLCRRRGAKLAALAIQQKRSRSLRICKVAQPGGLLQCISRGQAVQKKGAISDPVPSARASRCRQQVEIFKIIFSRPWHEACTERSEHRAGRGRDATALQYKCFCVAGDFDRGANVLGLIACRISNARRRDGLRETRRSGEIDGGNWP